MLIYVDSEQIARFVYWYVFRGEAHVAGTVVGSGQHLAS